MNGQRGNVGRRNKRINEIGPPLNSSISFNSYTVANLPPFGRLYRFCRTFAELRTALSGSCRCRIVAERQLRMAVGSLPDGARKPSGWAGLPTTCLACTEPPANPHPSYSRLARLDCVGLVWILNGRPVIALTGAAATIRATAGNLTWRRRRASGSVNLSQ